MTRAALILAFVGGVSLWAQAPAERPPDLPAFEVVSVRPNNSVSRGGSISGPNTSQFRVVNLPLRSIILYAYDVRDVQLVDAPEWIRAEKFDIAATYPEGADRPAQARLMLQQVLADRFQLRVRRERRDIPIYRLVMARADGRLGPNLVQSDVDCAKWLAEKRSQIIGQPPIGPAGARPACMMVAQTNYILGGTQPIERLARGLEFSVARPVIDETGLAGHFNIDLQWTPAQGIDPQGSAASTSDNGPSLFAAIQEQLGIRLEASVGSVEVLAIDSVERPKPD